MTLSWDPETDERDLSWARKNLVFEYRHVFGTTGIKDIAIPESALHI
jgi:hypothetical protein